MAVFNTYRDTFNHSYLSDNKSCFRKTNNVCTINEGNDDEKIINGLSISDI